MITTFEWTWPKVLHLWFWCQSQLQICFGSKDMWRKRLEIDITHEGEAHLFRFIYTIFSVFLSFLLRSTYFWFYFYSLFHYYYNFERRPKSGYKPEASRSLQSNSLTSHPAFVMCIIFFNDCLQPRPWQSCYAYDLSMLHLAKMRDYILCMWGGVLTNAQNWNWHKYW